MMEKRHTVLVWSTKGLADLRSDAYLEKKQEFLNGIILLQRLSSFRPRDALSAENLIALLEETEKLKETLMTCCKAAETIAAADSKISAEKVNVMEKALILRKVSKEIQDYFQEALDKKIFSSELAKKWLEEKRKSGSESSQGLDNKVEMLVLEPLFSLYFHLKGSIQTTVIFPDGSIKRASPSAINFLLKNTAEPEKRKRIFNALSASFAQNSTVFCDILNSVTGAHFLHASRNNQTILEYALCQENIGKAAFDAVSVAYWERMPELRKVIRFLGSCLGNETSQALPTALFGTALPHLSCPSHLRSFEMTLQVLEKAVRDVFPNFSEFLEECRNGRWIETHNYSGGAGGAWCSEIPSDRAVAVYVDYEANINRAFETAHTLGDAFLRWSTFKVPYHQRRLSELRCEFIGRLFEELLLRHLLMCTQKPEDRCAILWHGLRRLVINLVQIPFRFRLVERIYAERSNGYLSVEKINDLTRTCWTHFFQDTVADTDQYIWARKPHFYNPVRPHHDFQYTLGFLSANLLIAALKKYEGQEDIGKSILEACALYPYEEIFRRILNIDIEQNETWKKALDEALLPMGEIRSYMSYIFRKED
ncbi:hypothetical protein [Turicimonas muris]|uniref:hypothetical protein n=1 Tax=Turicimonas muris TaxID=1796652 RepID=UPI0026E01093|nr:hypothetical protein [Turicimonas muris]